MQEIIHTKCFGYLKENITLRCLQILFFSIYVTYVQNYLVIETFILGILEKDISNIFYYSIPKRQKGNITR